MKRLLSGLAAIGLGVSVIAGSASGAHAVTPPSAQMPCGSLTLTVYHAAQADGWDSNQDGMECHGTEHTAPGSTDNFDDFTQLAPYTRAYKFFSWNDWGKKKEQTGVVKTNLKHDWFTVWANGQEDDPNFNGCQYRCKSELLYDSNDLFFLDYGDGSVKVTMATFERYLNTSQHRFTILYRLNPAEKSIFSFDLVPSPPQPPPGPQPLPSKIVQRGFIHTDHIDFKVTCPKNRPAQIRVLIVQVKQNSGTYPDGDWDIVYGDSRESFRITCTGSAQKVTVPLYPYMPEANNRGGLFPGFASAVSFQLFNADDVSVSKQFFDSFWLDTGSSPDGYLPGPRTKIVN